MRFLILLSLLSCGRGDSRAMGTAGGPCFPNATCDAGLVCNGDGACVHPDPCAGVACSGHGTCEIINGQISCRCEPGFQTLGTRCLPCAEPSCASPCPADMVFLADQGACVDRFEATIFTNADCTGTRYGAGASYDFPSGFNTYVESVGCTGTCCGETTSTPSIDLFACSVAGQRPTAFASYFQARRACENSGKVLCTLAEWSSACSPAGLAYPYGNDYVASACQGPEATASVATGSMTECQGGVTGLFDMSGNLGEWADRCNGETAEVMGGSFATINAEDMRCGADDGYRQARHGNRTTGFRCCLRL